MSNGKNLSTVGNDQLTPCRIKYLPLLVCSFGTRLFTSCGKSRTIVSTVVCRYLFVVYIFPPFHFLLYTKALFKKKRNDLDSHCMFLACYAFQISIHSVWKERNRRDYGEPPLPTTSLLKIIDKNVQVSFCLSTVTRSNMRGFFEFGSVPYMIVSFLKQPVVALDEKQSF